jgi:hypothetical protein
MQERVKPETRPLREELSHPHPLARRDVRSAQARAFGFPILFFRGAARLYFTARIEGAHSDRAASASKKDGLAVPLPPFQAHSFSLRDGG